MFDLLHGNELQRLTAENDGMRKESSSSVEDMKMDALSSSISVVSIRVPNRSAALKECRKLSILSGVSEESKAIKRKTKK